jgi:serine protease Do
VACILVNIREITPIQRRTRMYRALLLLPLLAALSAAPAPVRADAPCCTEGYADLLGRVLPSVVSLSVTKVASMESSGTRTTARRQRFFGSGFIIDPKGIIVTNRHVVQDAIEITAIFHDNTQAPARLIAAANGADLAVLQVNVGHPLTALNFANSDFVHIGDEVLAIGNPYGLGMSASAGIVSGLNRNLNETPFDDDIQTDAAINPGNSGGPLINTAGEVVGVDTAFYSQTGGGYIGIGYAIPANDADFVIRHLLDPTLPSPGWLGIRVQDVSPLVAKGFDAPTPGGALITAVDKAGPAYAAGLQPGDDILSVAGDPVTDSRDLLREIGELDLGSPVDLTIWRDHRQQTVSVTPAAMPNIVAPAAVVMAPDAMAEMAPTPGPGAKLAVLNEAARQQFKIAPSITGVLVQSVASDTSSGEQGLQPGDVIINVNGTAVDTPDEIDSVIRKARAEHQVYVPFLVSGKEGLRWVTIYTGMKAAQ